MAYTQVKFYLIVYFKRNSLILVKYTLIKLFYFKIRDMTIKCNTWFWAEKCYKHFYVYKTLLEQLAKLDQGSDY